MRARSPSRFGATRKPPALPRSDRHRAPCPPPPASSRHPARTEPHPVGGGTLTLQTTLFGRLTVPNDDARASELEELSRHAAVYATRARGDGTRRAYRSAWHRFDRWCASLGREPLAADPDPIAMYVVHCAGQVLAVSSISVALAEIRTAHLLAGLSVASDASPWWSRASPGPRTFAHAVRPGPRCRRCSA